MAKIELQDKEYNILGLKHQMQHKEHFQQIEQQTDSLDAFDKPTLKKLHQHSLVDDTAIISAMSFLKIANSPDTRPP